MSDDQPPSRWGRAAIARAAVARIVAPLDLRVVLPDGTTWGGGGPASPALVVHRPDAFFARLGVDAKIGFGEGYMAGDWSAAPGTDLADALLPFARRMAHLVPAPLQRLRRLNERRRSAAIDGSPTRAPVNARHHYDQPVELFAAFLDETLTYSAARFAGAHAAPGATIDGAALAAAQRHKVDTVLDLAAVDSGTRLLEIGTGWGQLAIQAAERGAQVTTITLAPEQQRVTLERVARAGLGDRVDVVLADYREVPGTYDAIVSVEMIEAVGEQYWPEFFSMIERCLAPGGRVGLQAITIAHDRLLATRRSHSWIHEYIFPGGLIPSVEAIEMTVRGHTSLDVERRDAFGVDYATTLRCWRERFVAHRSTLPADRFDDVFCRMWELYLAYCEAGFRAGYLDVAQFALRHRAP